jgi:hypothetical protein
MRSEPSMVGAQHVVARRGNELERQLAEALGEQSATHQILRVVSISPSDVQQSCIRHLGSVDCKASTLQMKRPLRAAPTLRS